MDYEYRIVAFIDILGFKKSVFKSTDNKKEFNKILKTLNDLRDCFLDSRDVEQKKEEKVFGEDTQIIQVSDSLIISKLLHEKGGLNRMFFNCSYAIHILIENGYLCRGAITIGKTYHNGTTIFGEAYTRAVLAEKSGKMPLIRFEEELFDVAKYFPHSANEGFEDWEIKEIKKNCKRLRKGIYYLNYFTDYDDRFGAGEGTASTHYSVLRDIIIEGLTNTDNENILKKYKWAKLQFNISAKKYGLNEI